MAKLTKILRSADPVSETESNVVFELLIPIVEAAPSAADAVDTAGSVIGRCRLGDDRLLAHVLDWWYVVTTGRQSANGGAHRLPEALDESVRVHMDAVTGLGIELPAAEWLDKRRQLDSMLAGLDETLRLDHYGSVKLPGEREAWRWLIGKLTATAGALRANRRAVRAEIDWRRADNPARSVRVGPCSSEREEWVVFAGGVWVTEPGCVELVAASGNETVRVRLPVGEACDPEP